MNKSPTPFCQYCHVSVFISSKLRPPCVCSSETNPLDEVIYLPKKILHYHFYFCKHFGRHCKGRHIINWEIRKICLIQSEPPSRQIKASPSIQLLLDFINDWLVAAKRKPFLGGLEEEAQDTQTVMVPLYNSNLMQLPTAIFFAIFTSQGLDFSQLIFCFEHLWKSSMIGIKAALKVRRQTWSLRAF